MKSFESLRIPLFGIALVLIALLVGGAVFLNLTAPSADCATHASARVNIVLDRTRPYSPIQKLNLDKSVAQIVKSAPSNAQINVFYITPDGDQPKTVLSLCRPNDVNVLTGDPEEVSFQLQREVVDSIRKIVDLPLKKASESPIVETLDTLSREKLISGDNGPNAMYLFSDMIQNSENGSLLGCTSRGPGQISHLSEYSDRVAQFYSDVPFHVIIIVRNPAKERNIPSASCLRLFWEKALPDIKTWDPL
jgi:hypothetical protein